MTPALLFVCDNLRAGGAERQWASLVPALQRDGFRVEVLTLDGRGPFFDELQSAGVATECAELRHRADPAGLTRASRIAHRARPDVVVTRSVSAHVAGHLLARRIGARHVTTEHLGPDPRGVQKNRPHQEMMMRLVRPRVSSVVAVSRSQEPTLLAAGYRRDRLRVVPNGVASHPEIRAREDVRAELGLAQDAFVAVLAARLRVEKRAPAFVRAVTRAHELDSSIVGLVLGDGPEYDRVAAGADASRGAVRMAGFRPDALDVIAAADALCLTSEVEALPMSVLEAMSVGTPVVSTRVGGVGEAVSDGESGMLVDPADTDGIAHALVTLAGDRPRARALGEAGRERQRRCYSVEAMTEGYAEVLSQT